MGRAYSYFTQKGRGGLSSEDLAIKNRINFGTLKNLSTRSFLHVEDIQIRVRDFIRSQQDGNGMYQPRLNFVASR